MSGTHFIWVSKSTYVDNGTVKVPILAKFGPCVKRSTSEVWNVYNVENDESSKENYKDNQVTCATNNIKYLLHNEMWRLYTEVLIYLTGSMRPPQQLKNIHKTHINNLPSHFCFTPPSQMKKPYTLDKHKQNFVDWESLQTAKNKRLHALGKDGRQD